MLRKRKKTFAPKFAKTQILLIPAICFLFSAKVYSGKIALFEDAVSQHQLLEKHDPDYFVLPSIEKKPVAVNPLFSAAENIRENELIKIELLDEKKHVAQVKSAYRDVQGVSVVLGDIKGSRYGSLVLTTHRGRTRGLIKIPEKKVKYRITTPKDTEAHYLKKINIEKLDRTNPAPPLNPEDYGIYDKDQNHKMPDIKHYDDPWEYAVINVLVVYTPAFASEFGGGVNSKIAEQMANANIAVENSNTNMEFALVHTSEVDYEESGNAERDITRLTASPYFNPFGDEYDGYLEEVHYLREEYSADLVAMFCKHIGGMPGGLAWMLIDEKGSPEIGFSISYFTRDAVGGGPYVHAHEMGHNMGLHHSRNQSAEAAPEEGGVFEYSTGWRWESGGNEYVSVMTYPEGAEQVPYFSNPDINHHGVPTGSYDEDDPHAPADNARTIREMKHIIANYMGALNPFNIYNKPVSYPNPMRKGRKEDVKITLPASPEGLIETVKVYNAAGRFVNELDAEEMYAHWDGKNSSGDRCAPGLYYYAIRTTEDSIYRGKLTIVP